MIRSVRRRTFLAASAAAWAVHCDRHQPHAQAAPGVDWKAMSFEPQPGFADGQRVEVLIPADENRPVLIALHGRGEAGRGLRVGSRAWRDDYELGAMVARVKNGKLDKAALHGFAEEKRLAAFHDSLAKHPFEGLFVACPACPVLSDRTPQGVAPFGSFIVDKLLPRLATELKAAASVGAKRRVGIDGVSMGGRQALFIGLSHPHVFSTIGALQPALAPAEAADLAVFTARALAKVNPAPKLRLVSSTDDPFLAAVRAYSQELNKLGASHELVVTPGPHDYIYNRGPGAAEMLLWHERVLSGWPSP